MQAVFNCSYYITGSKSALTLATKGSPCGSYTTIQSWIADQGKEEIHCPQDPDVVTFFDNNQVFLKFNECALVYTHARKINIVMNLLFLRIIGFGKKVESGGELQISGKCNHYPHPYHPQYDGSPQIAKDS